MPPDPASLLLSKARDDEKLAILVAGNPSVSDEHIGFLCQQAIEKAIKAVLSQRGIRYRRTHDLSELVDSLKSGGVTYPAALEASVHLTPFAAEMRYDYLPPEEAGDTHFDRSGALKLVRVSIAWAEELVGRTAS